MAKDIVLENTTNLNENQYHDTPMTASAVNDPEIPAKIVQMMQLYEYGDGSYEQQKKNFLLQGEFMKDFEDDYDGWSGKCTYFSPSYHNLTLSQLRKYFTWRSAARKGSFTSIEAPFVYLYLSELLCGIGGTTPEETLKKMADLENGFVNSGYADTLLQMHIKEWIFEYAVIHDFPPETVMHYADPRILAHDTYLSILRNPASKKDDEIFMALSFFAEKDLFLSPAITECGSEGKHLFAELWKCVSVRFNEDDTDFFTACFGEPETSKWYPLFNALFRDDGNDSDKECTLSECRKYFCRGGVWHEECFNRIQFDKVRFNALLHEAERVFRKYLKLGRTLRQKPDETWATQYAEAVVAADKKAEAEAKRPKINIDLSGLDKIRRDAAVTRESLLTEEEIEDEIESEPTSESNENGLLDAVHTGILRNLLKKGSADDYIKAAHLMPSVVADTINSALFDEIGDNVIECDGKTLAIIEDYVEDIAEILHCVS